MELNQEYTNQEIQQHYFGDYSGGRQGGIWTNQDCDFMIFIVTLKQDRETNRYADRFLDAFHFEWHPQANNKTWGRPNGQQYQHLISKTKTVHLFTRHKSGMKYTYHGTAQHLANYDNKHVKQHNNYFTVLKLDSPNPYFNDTYIDEPKPIAPKQPRQTPTRKYQNFFRAVTLERYPECLLCGIQEPRLLEAAHIIPYSQNTDHQYNPNNALTLCANHHKAYDAKLWQLDCEGRAKTTHPELSVYNGQKLRLTNGTLGLLQQL